MKYFKQLKEYTCGVACFRMVLSAQGLPDVEDDTLEVLMDTTYESGTHYDAMVAAADKFGMDCLSGQNATLESVDKLTQEGWTVVLAYSVDVPHYALYTKHTDSHVILCDPHFGEKIAFEKAKFERHTWAVEVSRYQAAIADLRLELDKSLDTKCWFVAYMKKHENILHT